ncbi:MAG: hypothetical protein ACI8WB_005955 [Phenylobacterium sp.]|jgi:hypothetical protein
MMSQTDNQPDAWLGQVQEMLITTGAIEYTLSGDNIEEPSSTSDSTSSSTMTLTPASLICKVEDKDGYLSGIVDSLNRFNAAHLSQSHQLLSNLSANADFAKAQETDMVLLHRFVQRREAFLQQHPLLEAKEFAKLTGFTDSNVSRKVAQLKSKNKLLFVQMGGINYFPAFQLNSQAQFYPALQKNLPIIMAAGRTGWDICFWLHTALPVILSEPTIANDLTQLSLDEAIDLANQVNQDADIFTEPPIKALHQGNINAFDACVKEWLDPDGKVIKKQIKKGKIAGLVQ